MAMIGKVKRMYFRQKKSVREIVRLTSLSRNTVRKWLKTPVLEEPIYRRGSEAGQAHAVPRDAQAGAEGRCPSTPARAAHRAGSARA